MAKQGKCIRCNEILKWEYDVRINLYYCPDCGDPLYRTARVEDKQLPIKKKRPLMKTERDKKFKKKGSD